MSVRILVGDCRETLRGLAAGSAHVSITSPPYWGLREYGTEPLVWGGAEGCEHEWGEERIISAGRNDQDRDTRHTDGRNPETQGLVGCPKQQASQGQFCQLCNAWRGSLGLEPTPELYTQHLVEIFREVRRVMRDDGVLFLDLGDSYASGKGSCHNPGGGEHSLGQARKGAGAHPLHRGNTSDLRKSGLKPKDLVGIPWRVAFALQADGWWLRSCSPWIKRSAMPESVRDRPTTAHEYIFLLSKSKTYFYDGDAVRVTYSGFGKPRAFAHQGNEDRNDTGRVYEAKDNGGRNRRTSDPFFESLDLAIEQCRIELFRAEHVIKPMLAKMTAARDGNKMLTDERGNPLAFTVNTQGFSEAHFATFPPRLVEPMIKAGASEWGVCPECGAQWTRVIERTGHENNREPAHQPGHCPTKTDSTGWAPTMTATDKWIPGCDCNVGMIESATVLDPFGGSGTTGLVADRLGRNAILCELNAEYAEMARDRITGDAPMFVDLEVINS